MKTLLATIATITLTTYIAKAVASHHNWDCFKKEEAQ